MAESGDAAAFRERLHVIDGTLDALNRLDAVNAAVRTCSDRKAAMQTLLGSPFNYTEVVANHVLDLTVGKQTQKFIEGLHQERRTVAEKLEALRGSD